jgi:hypothetical protein
MLGRKERSQLELFISGTLRQLIPDDRVLVRAFRQRCSLANPDTYLRRGPPIVIRTQPSSWALGRRLPQLL